MIAKVYLDKQFINKANSATIVKHFGFGDREPSDNSGTIATSLEKETVVFDDNQALLCVLNALRHEGFKVEVFRN